jgi:hypothetical protein
LYEKSTLFDPKSMKAKTVSPLVPSNEDALTKADLAKRFGKTARTIDNWMASGLPYYKLGKSCYFKWSAIQKWIDDKRTINKTV